MVDTTWVNEDRRDPANEVTRSAIDNIKANMQELSRKIDNKQEKIPIWLIWAVFLFMFSTIGGIVKVSAKQDTATQVMATKMDHLNSAIKTGVSDRFSNSAARYEFNLRDDRILNMHSLINEHTILLKEMDKRLDKFDKMDKR